MVYISLNPYFGGNPSKYKSQIPVNNALDPGL